MNQAQMTRTEATERFVDHLQKSNLTIRGGCLESTVDPELARMRIRLEMIEVMRPIAELDKSSLSEKKRTTAADELDLRAQILATETGIPFATAYTKVFDDNAELRKRYSQEQAMHQRRFLDNADTEE